MLNVRRPLASLLVALLVAVPSAAALGPAAIAATPAESDIPGVPLPASVVSGQLGGPIYDVVYRVDVPAGQVLVVGLTGTSGTDFDLYLFDSSATTVLSKTGLLAKSTGPTSSEHLSWPTRTGGTFYVDLNGASNVEGTYTLSVQVLPDATPPVASLHVANGVTTVNTPTVTLQLGGFDDLSSVTAMSLSNDGATYSPAVPFAGQFNWVVPAGDGVKTIWARVMNGVGLWSQPVSVSVTLDTTSPTVVSFSPPSQAVVTTARPTISVTFSEPVLAASWTSLGLVLQSASGDILPGVYAYSADTKTGTFTPSSDLSPGYVYVATVAAVQDLAGNRVAGAASWTLSYVPRTSVTAMVTPAVSVAGTRVTLSGSASVPAGESLLLEAMAGAATAYTPIGTITPSGGSYAVSLVPSMTTHYRVSYGGSVVASPAAAVAASIVRRAVSMLGVSASSTQRARVGTPVALPVQVAPGGVTTVALELYHYDTARHGWVRVAIYGRVTRADGRVGIFWTPRTAGSWFWRVAVGSTPDFATNTSPVYRYWVSG